jgi:hypothetical protein
MKMKANGFDSKVVTNTSEESTAISLGQAGADLRESDRGGLHKT